MLINNCKTILSFETILKYNSIRGQDDYRHHKFITEMWFLLQTMTTPCNANRESINVSAITEQVCSAVCSAAKSNRREWRIIGKDNNNQKSLSTFTTPTYFCTNGAHWALCRATSLIRQVLSGIISKCRSLGAIWFKHIKILISAKVFFHAAKN